MTTPMVEPRANASSVVCVVAAQIASTRAAQDADGQVRSVPRDQLYFWSHAWQKMEQQATQDLASGAFDDFDDPAAALRWLLSTED